MKRESDSAVRIGSRGSPLALWQARWIERLLLKSRSELRIERVTIATSGDRTLDRPLDRMGGKGVFTREIEEALLDGRIDLAVHSLKDLPTTLPDGLAIGAVCEREDPSDAFVPRRGLDEICSLRDLRPNAVVATGSVRRRSQLLHLRPDIRFADVRGNIETRLRKLDESEWDGAILACVGLARLGLPDRIAFAIPMSEMLPAVGQGIVAIEIRESDGRVAPLVTAIDHSPTRVAAKAERAFLHRLGGGCHVPIAARAEIAGETLRLEGLVASVDGRECLRDSIEGATVDAVSLGERLAGCLIASGGERILGGGAYA